jgi:hypothetical protein
VSAIPLLAIAIPPDPLYNKITKAGGADECITAFYQKNVILSIDRS